MASTPVYCANHPNTETLLRCYRCGKPVCVKCVRRTPVGLICKECLSNQQSGYYTVIAIDYVITAIVALLVSIAGGAIAALIGFFLFQIFYAPFAGGAIAEVVRYAIRRRRGRYIWLIACAMVVIGGIVGASLIPLFGILGRGGLLLALNLLPALAIRAAFNLGFLIYLALAVGTVYTRLR